MRKVTKLIMALSLIFFACEAEKVDQDETLKSVSATATILKECVVQDVDRCPFGDQQPASNFWWSLNGGTDYFVPSTYFSSTADHKITFTEFDDGTAHISGSTVQGTCVVEVDVWLKNRLSWAEWSSQAVPGEHKKEGCAGDASNADDMNYYVIDSEKSTMTASGDCAGGTGTFGIEQRPDPVDESTPNYGAHVGPGGANYDSDLNAYGLSTWGWITDLVSGERLWLMDFNFKFDCEVRETECETAFAYSGAQEDCFLNSGFNRWGWTIGPLEDGDSATYDVYAGAGQCDLNKGELVGTVDVTYLNGEVEVTYNIDSSYNVEETHVYAGTEMFPTNKKGKPTVAPGQYENLGGFDGPVYVIAHAVVCK